MFGFPTGPTARAGVHLDRFPSGYFNTLLPSLSLTRRIEGLDELRGLSTLWVMICHGTGLVVWQPRALGGYGFHGVVLFFIISGYLITTILLRSSEAPGALKNFYIRRAIRIWPLMLAVLLVGAAWMPEYSSSIIYNLLLVNNYSMGMGVEPVFRTDVMWSLAIEEQFYLLWPLIVFAAGKGRLTSIVFAVIFAGFCFDGGILPLMQGIPVFKTTQGCMQYIALGAAVALGRSGLYAAAGAIACFLGLFLLKHGSQFFEQLRYVWWGATILLFVVVYLTVHRGPLIRSAFLAHIGQLCYGLYLIHFFMSYWTLTHIGEGYILPWLVFVSSSYILALISFNFFEKPIIELRPSIEGSSIIQTNILLGVMFTLLVCVVSVVAKSVA